MHGTTTQAAELLKPFGPIYDLDSAALQKHRRIARAVGSVADMSREQRRAYGEAVEAATRAKHRAHLTSGGERMPKPRCASGTWHTDGADIHRAIQQQHRSQAAALVNKVRRERTPAQWQAMYEEAMKAKRAAAQHATSNAFVGLDI